MSRRADVEKKFMAIAAIVWIMLSVALPIVNKPDIRIVGIPLLWFWVMAWVFVVPVVLTIAYYVLEVMK